MSPGMPDTGVMHIRRNLSPCVLHPLGELLDAGNRSQLGGALLQNRPEVFRGTGLCAVPMSNISHPEKEQVVATPILHLFGRPQRISTGLGLFAGIWQNCARGNVTSRSQSRQSRMVDKAIANTSLYALVEDEPLCRLACN